MTRKHLTPYDRLPPNEKELLDEWNAIVLRYEKGPDGLMRPKADTAPRLAALYKKCFDSSGWCVTSFTAAIIAACAAGQAMVDHDWRLAIELWNRFLAHPDAKSIDQVSRVSAGSRHAAAHFLVGETGTAAAMWLELIREPKTMKSIFRSDMATLCEFLAEANPTAPINPQLLPVIAELKYRSKRIKEITDGTRQATYAEMAELLEAIRAKAWAKRQAKLGKPTKHAS